MKRHGDDELVFEDSLSDDWSRDIKVAEVPIGNRPLLALGLGVLAVCLVIAGQVLYLNFSAGAYYTARAADNVADESRTPAPRGEILDKEGDVLAEDKAAFAAVLDARAFADGDPALQSSTVAAAENVLGLAPDVFAAMLSQAKAADFSTPVVLAENLTPVELVNLQALDLPTIRIQNDFERDYPDGAVFSSVVGYTGRPTAADLRADPSLTTADFVGKAGIEAFYDSTLRGIPGVDVQYKDARGQVLGEGERSQSQVGTPLTLTVDGGLQAELYNRLAGGLASLGRTIGLGLAIDPRNGQVLALVNLPGYDNNIFSQPGPSSTAVIKSLLTSPDEPMFDRTVSGNYNPGSTIKPLDAVAALKEGVIDPTREIYSPGYLMVPNPYSSSTPTKYLDWQYQGRVDLAAALAQSSDVYFYLVGGGSPASTPMLNDPSDYGIQGLGITRLYQWWQTFGLGKPTGIDMPNEGDGFLPTPAWKQAHFGTPWLLGDTYNVSIGQGDLLLTPLQLLSYIGAIANGGTIWRPYLNASSTPQVNEDLTSLLPQIADVQQGMLAGVSSPRGTSHSLADLPFCVAAKTGSAQVHDNSQENALFVGYAPCDHPQIALLILIENSKQGSLNAVPIAKDVLNWYYENRLAASQ
ncbi:MAG TPA: penicillin-binding transpeptidase domain-containing protein [Candidatus Paceibacterota bacterium]|nr:penicillin-binding transpeptidase domain-containing protein [Candidatus Paceibacterota bacterium]